LENKKEDRIKKEKKRRGQVNKEGAGLTLVGQGDLF
jgi:hypothetical protein